MMILGWCLDKEMERRKEEKREKKSPALKILNFQRLLIVPIVPPPFNFFLFNFFFCLIFFGGRGLLGK